MVHADAVMTDTVVGVGLCGLRGAVTSDLHTAQTVGAITGLHTLPQVFLAQIYSVFRVLSGQGGGCLLPSVAVE